MEILQIITNVVVIIAFVIAIWQFIETRNHNKISLLPALYFSKSFDFRSKTLKIMVINHGSGLAIIDSFYIIFNNERIFFPSAEEWAALFKSEGMDFSGEIYITKLIEKSVLGSGQSITVMEIFIEKSTNTDLSSISEYLSKIPIVVEYRSIYNNPQKTTSVNYN